MRASKSALDVAMLEELEQGLLRTPKHLPSWLFYNADGDKLFQAIMKLSEYYPTRCEFEILQDNRELLLAYFLAGDKSFELLEFGAGDGTKTELLLEFFLAENTPFLYRPVDISQNVLDQLKTRLDKKLPGLIVDPVCARYESAVNNLSRISKRVILFLGANIGNYTTGEASAFMKTLSQQMNDKDLCVVGFDLKKDPRVIQKAYDDSKGVTRDFNLNLLRRLNDELGANFELRNFSHYPVYNPLTGAAESYLVSRKDQEVYIDALHRSVFFEAWETIHTEISQKYDVAMIDDLATNSGLEIVDMLYDSRKYFCDVIFRKVGTKKAAVKSTEAVRVPESVNLNITQGSLAFE